jgi:hypothetical protein
MNMLQKYRKEENRRENIVKEIYSTEVTYTNQLRSLSTIYFKELVESGLMEDSMKLIAAQLKGQVDVILVCISFFAVIKMRHQKFSI